MNDNPTTTDHIDHEATVMSIHAAHDLVLVKLGDRSNCNACAAAKICAQTTDAHPATISVWCRDAAKYHIGQRVLLRGTERMHRRAIMLATVLPCICLIAVMTIVYLLTFNQLAAALSGLGSMFVFFGIIWLARNRVAHEFSFSIVGPMPPPTFNPGTEAVAENTTGQEQS